MAVAKNIDYLTGLPLRDSLYSSLEELVFKSGLEKSSFSIVLIDVDKFKEFNDKFGHFLGDRILEYVTHSICSIFCETECRFFRYGGDEFIVVILGQDAKQASNLVRRCTADLYKRPYMFKNKLLKITISCGIASFPEDGLMVEELFRKADRAMYFSKRRGRNIITLAGEMQRLKVLRALLAMVRIAGVTFLLMLVLWFPPVRAKIQAAVDSMKKIKIITEADDITTLRLKNDTQLQGRIIKETDDGIVLEITVDKSRIEAMQ